ncbi:MAG: hypothetical protein WCR46_12635, partial [Deltaproteobacteria bacterium]
GLGWGIKNVKLCQFAVYINVVANKEQTIMKQPLVPYINLPPDRDGLATTLNFGVFFVGNHLKFLDLPGAATDGKTLLRLKFALSAQPERRDISTSG